jgi:hypothetical protein
MVSAFPIARRNRDERYAVDTVPRIVVHVDTRNFTGRLFDRDDPDRRLGVSAFA